MSNVWISAGLWLAFYCLIGLLAGLFLGLAWGLVVLIGLLLLTCIRQLRQLERFLIWAKQPAGTQPPDTSGIWEDLFATLTKRVRAANALRDELNGRLLRFRQAAEAMPDGVLTLANGQIIDWFNSTAAGHFGLQPGTDVGAPLGNLVRRPDFTAYLDAGGYTEPLILHPVRPGEPSLLIQIAPFGEDQTLVLSRDITHLQKLERMRSDFVANVSHELKTPLTVVVGFIETLLDFDDQVSPDDSRHYLTLALTQATRMTQLVEDLLTLASLETDAPPANEERVDLAALVRQVTTEAEALSDGRHRILLEGGPAVMLNGSRKELHSALGNLATNAVRYTPEGGEIRLHWANLPNGGLDFWVVDTGLGIAAEHIPRLTERFYRVDRGRSRESGGTGLGLAIVKHVMTRHQGELRIESEPGKGSRFIARFPPHRVQAAP